MLPADVTAWCICEMAVITRQAYDHGITTSPSHLATSRMDNSPLRGCSTLELQASIPAVFGTVMVQKRALLAWSL